MFGKIALLLTAHFLRVSGSDSGKGCGCVVVCSDSVNGCACVVVSNMLRAVSHLVRNAAASSIL